VLLRLFKYAIHKGINGPGRSWLFTSAAMTLFRFARNRMGRRGVTEQLATEPGDKIIIEHLDVSHKQQIKQFKKSKVSKNDEIAQAKQLKKELRRARKS